MTDLLLDPNDTGEIPPPGEITVALDTIDTGEATQRIHPNVNRLLVEAPSFTAIPRRESADTEIVVGETIGVVPDLGDAQPIGPWGRVADPETAVLSLLGSVAGLDGELRPAAPGPFPTPLPPPPPPAPPAPSDYVGRHRLTFRGRMRRVPLRLALAAAVTAAVYAGLVLAAVAVIR